MPSKKQVKCPIADKFRFLHMHNAARGLTFFVTFHRPIPGKVTLSVTLSNVNGFRLLSGDSLTL